MDCTEYRDLFEAHLNGNLGPEDADRLMRHLAVCDSCNREYRDAEWLVSGMRSARDEIRSEHVASTLLYHFVRSPQSLDAETAGFVRAHMDRCDQCKHDASGIEHLLRIEIDTPPPIDSPPRRPTGIWRGAVRGRLMLLYVAAAVVAVFLVTWAVLTSDEALPQMVKIVSPGEVHRSGLPIVTLINDLTTRGTKGPAEGAPTVIDESHGQSLVLTLEAVTFSDEDMTYGVRIERLDGGTVWQSDVGVELLESGSLWLMVNRDGFEPGVFKLSVLEQEGNFRAPVSTARFEIRR